MAIPANNIGVFVGSGSRFPSGIFSSKKLAQEWISRYKLTGTLTIIPVDEGVFDWALANDMLNLKKEKIPEKSLDPRFVADCLPASLEHYHFNNGKVD